jgi:hypothetical protein
MKDCMKFRDYDDEASHNGKKSDWKRDRQMKQRRKAEQQEDNFKVERENKWKR